MTFDEFKPIAATLKSAYTSVNFLPDKETMLVWYKALNDLDAKEVQIAISKWIMTERFPPTIADIRGTLAKAKTNAIDWSEAWGLVIKAVRNYGYAQEDEALGSLPPTVREATRRMGWKSVCMSNEEDLGVIRGQFRRIYELAENEAVEMAQIPESMRQMINGMAEWLLEAKDEGN